MPIMGHIHEGKQTDRRTKEHLRNSHKYWDASQYCLTQDGQTDRHGYWDEYTKRQTRKQDTFIYIRNVHSHWRYKVKAVDNKRQTDKHVFSDELTNMSFKINRKTCLLRWTHKETNKKARHFY
jgi:hypothetical protein